MYERHWYTLFLYKHATTAVEARCLRSAVIKTLSDRAQSAFLSWQRAVSENIKSQLRRQMLEYRIAAQRHQQKLSRDLNLLRERHGKVTGDTFHQFAALIVQLERIGSHFEHCRTVLLKAARLNADHLHDAAYRSVSFLAGLKPLSTTHSPSDVKRPDTEAKTDKLE